MSHKYVPIVDIGSRPAKNVRLSIWFISFLKYWIAANNGKNNGDQTDDSPAKKNCPARPSWAAYGPINGFCKLNLKKIRRPQKYTIRWKKSKMSRDKEDDSNPRFYLIRSISLWTIHLRRRYVDLDRIFSSQPHRAASPGLGPGPPRNKTKTNSHEKIENFHKFLYHNPQNFDPRFQMFSARSFKPKSLSPKSCSRNN